MSNRPVPARWNDWPAKPLPESDELAAREREEDALRGNNTTACLCFDAASMEFGPVPCDRCRSEALADIDRDGHDDKRETPEVA